MKHLEFEEDPTLNLPVMNNTESPRRPMKQPDFKPPAALKPGVDWDGEEVQVTSDVYAEPISDWDVLLSELGYDSDLYEIIEPVKISAWDVSTENGPRRMYSYKAGIRAKQVTRYRDDDYKEVVAQIKKHRPMREMEQGDSVFVINLADWQLGKADGDGTHGTVKRLLNRFDLIVDRINELKKSGRKIQKIIIAGIGDLEEGCEGHYSSQTFTVQLNRRQQIRLLRRLLTQLITRVAKLAPEIEVYSVPGNHGENRNGSGKAFTTRGDNDDVAVFEMVAEILSANPAAYGHVKFFLPEDEIYMIAEAAGKRIGFFHGHVTPNGADPQKKIREWWKNQAFSKNAIGFVDILVTGHYHHFSVVEYDGEAIHMQCPAEDGGSEWFNDLTGVNSRPGTLTFLIDQSGKPYRDLEVL
jgi:predicted phosphodiesterase